MPDPAVETVEAPSVRRLVVRGQALEPLAEAALYWPAARALVVSDMHFEKGTSGAARGRLLPPYDTAETIRRLARLVERHDPQLVIALGDSFHDERAESRIAPELLARLGSLIRGRDWVWIAGNHDPLPPKSLGGEVMEALAVDGLYFQHEPAAGPAPGEIAGHLHPCAAIVQRGRRLRRRCFASDGERLVMPAFGAYTGGLNVLDSAYAPVFAGAFHAWMLARDGAVPVASCRLRPDGSSY